MLRQAYHTKQKDIIFDAIRRQKHEFSIKDIYEATEEEIGLTTIYRFIDQLVDEGRLKKFIGKDNITYYQYLEECEEENHFYLKCSNCGDMIHVDCSCIEDLSIHVLKKHQFILSRDNIVIEGICKNCIENSRKENV